MEIEPSISLVVNGELVSLHHLEVLRAVYEEGSQKKAAERLGISTPVLHRYLRRVEERVGTKTLIASPTGTRLTSEGEMIVLEYLALKTRMKQGNTTVVGGSIVTEDLLLSVLSKIDRVGRYDLIISDDERNLRDLQAGLMDLVVLDDPLYVFDLEGVKWEEIAEDDLVHVDRGSNYLRFKY
ncbi:MAG: LysR family transcriptional regulator, partial [Euryarchaeota archaeon]|nr:LysR family transcriptional regulator [Euryarchaeota archaeon]